MIMCAICLYITCCFRRLFEKRDDIGCGIENFSGLGKKTFSLNLPRDWVINAGIQKGANLDH